MSILEQTSFIKNIHPFDNLSKQQLEEIASNLDIIYFKKSEIIQQSNTHPQKLYFIIKGVVQEIKEEEVISLYSVNEVFDAKSLLENYSKNAFVTAQETICYALDREIFIKILHDNSSLESYFFQSISQKLNANISNEKSKELSNMMVAKVKDATVHKAVIIPYNTTIYEAALRIKKEKVPTLLLNDEEKNIYIVTDSDFRQKVILNRMDYDDIVGKISTKGIISVYENDFLFNAQVLMTKHGIKRVAVTNDKEEIVGILDQISLSSFFATHTFSVSNKIEKAETVEDLKEASISLIKIIRSLNAKGVKIDFISKLINQLNQKIMNKLFLITAPPSLIGKSCLVVMGSEGRGEQVLKTDQDNALIVADDCEISEEELHAYTQQYTQYLVDFGFPRCEGNIMVSNPYWCRRHKDFKDLIFSWITNKTGDDFMNLAIFYDAVCASGDKKLMQSLKEHIFKVGANSQSFFMHFAKIITSFNVPLGFFDGFVFDNDNKDHPNQIDIKKGGIFILVQGIRSLSLEHKLFRTNTIRRIKELNRLGVFDHEFTQELIEAFNFLTTIKLKSNLAKLDAGTKIDNYINPNELNSMEKDLLKESFKIVNKLKKKLEFHYKLNYV
ncbi:MAG: putative nucleotidyltransferase substrate binding domain-containing protein [Arcobacteraceae bacterium]